MHQPLVSIIIPTIDINDYILHENLPAFTKQTYKKFEVIILPNQSSSKDIELTQKYNWLRIIPTEKITRPALKRDIGVKEAKGEIIAFIDDDAYPTPEWLSKAVPIFSKEKIEAVCGPGILPKNSSFWEKVFDEVLKTPVGSGGYSFRFVPKKRKYVDDYPSMNFLIKKSVFNELGGFNSDYWPGEDSKLCNDLVHKNHGKILYDPDVVIYHHRRETLKGYLKQHANYGFHRGAFFAHGDKNSKKLSYLLPSGLVIYLISLTFLLIVLNLFPLLTNPLYIVSIPLVFYIIGLSFTLASSFANEKSLKISFSVPLTIFLTHFLYGIMFVKGFIKGSKHIKNIYE